MRERLKKIASSVRRETVAALLLLALFASCAGLALGCGWYGFENSVRFNFSATDRDRSRLPPLPRLDVRGEKKAREGERVERVSPKHLAAQLDSLWDEAVEATSAGELLKAR